MSIRSHSAGSAKMRMPSTTTTFAGALAAYYHQTAVGHVEAGLRTYNKYSPFPEEYSIPPTSEQTV